MDEVKELKEFREQNDFNRKEMAELIGVSPSYYYKIESGFQNPSYEFLKKFKSKFPNAIIDELFFIKTKRWW